MSRKPDIDTMSGNRGKGAGHVRFVGACVETMVRLPADGLPELSYRQKVPNQRIELC